MITVVASYKAHIHHSVTLKALQHSVFTYKVYRAMFRSMRPIPLKHHVMVYKVLWRNMQPIEPGRSECTPSLLGFFHLHTQDLTASHPIRSTQKKWFNVLLSFYGIWGIAWWGINIYLPCGMWHKYHSCTRPHSLLVRNTRAWVQAKLKVGAFVLSFN